MATYTAPSSTDNFYNTYFDSNTAIEVGKEADGTSVDGAIRFTGINVPRNATIQSALLKYYVGVKEAGSGDLKAKIYGIAEDNTGAFSGSPMGRSRTSAVDIANWSLPGTGEYSNHDVTAIVQEIVNRGGWNSGNAMGFHVLNNGTVNNDVWVYDSYLGTNSQLEIIATGVSPSSSISPSISPSASRSPSASQSPSASLSPSGSVSSSASPTPPPDTHHGIMKVAKSGYNVLNITDPSQLKFSSEYGTLKYFTKQQVIISFDANAGDITARGQYDHNLGYYPFCEIFVRVYIGSPSGNYEYVPFFGSGASVAYSAIAKITKNSIVLYGEINGVSSSVWNFDFLIFVYKNKLNL